MELISGVVITLNEEKNIKACLESLKPFCDEIVVVDSFSTDKTLEIASRYTSRIFKRKPDKIIEQINYATVLASHKWVFFLDADERVTPSLAEKINTMKRDGFTADSYTVNRLNYYVNGFFKYCGWYPDTKIRLFDRTKGSWGGEEPHYKVVMNRDASTMHLKKDIIHFTYRDLTHQIEKMNRFSSQSAGSKPDRSDFTILLHLILNPLVRFVKCFFFQGGFLAGPKGLINSVIVSFYVFAKYAKMWEKKHARNPDPESGMNEW